MRTAREKESLFFKMHKCQSSQDSTEAIASYKFEHDTQWVTPSKQVPKEGKINILSCKHCGHLDFNEDGRFMNEYSCNGCDSFVEVIFKSH